MLTKLRIPPLSATLLFTGILALVSLLTLAYETPAAPAPSSHGLVAGRPTPTAAPVPTTIPTPMVILRPTSTPRPSQTVIDHGCHVLNSGTVTLDPNHRYMNFLTGAVTRTATAESVEFDPQEPGPFQGNIDFLTNATIDLVGLNWHGDFSIACPQMPVYFGPGYLQPSRVTALDGMVFIATPADHHYYTKVLVKQPNGQNSYTPTLIFIAYSPPH